MIRHAAYELTTLCLKMISRLVSPELFAMGNRTEARDCRERRDRVSMAYKTLADMLYLEALDLHLLPFAISRKGRNIELHG